MVCVCVTCSVGLRKQIEHILRILSGCGSSNSRIQIIRVRTVDGSRSVGTGVGARTKVRGWEGKGGGHGQMTTQISGGLGEWPPGNILNFGSLKRHFLDFEDTFEQNIKVLNRCHFFFNCTHKFANYFRNIVRNFKRCYFANNNFLTSQLKSGWGGGRREGLGPPTSR